MALALFDLDKTLIAKNSGSLWLKQEIRERRVHPWDALRASWFVVQYTFGFVDLEAGVVEMIATLRGTLEAELDQRVARFYEREVRPLYRPEARRVIAEHRAQGDTLALVTSASCYLAAQVARELGFDQVVANRFEVGADGRFTGRPEGRVCFGTGKRELAQALAVAQGVALETCTFYSDSMADLPLLETVGRPVAVNPDPRLLRIARTRGWTISDWGTPSARVTSEAP